MTSSLGFKARVGSLIRAWQRHDINKDAFQYDMYHMWSLCPGGLYQGASPRRGQTDACENITLPQTSFEGGKNVLDSVHDKWFHVYLIHTCYAFPKIHLWCDTC